LSRTLWLSAHSACDV